MKQSVKRLGLGFLFVILLPLSLFSDANLVIFPSNSATTNGITTWNIVGTDSNKPYEEGPDEFLTGIVVCNYGPDVALDVNATFVWDEPTSWNYNNQDVRTTDTGKAWVELSPDSPIMIEHGDIPVDDGTGIGCAGWGFIVKVDRGTSNSDGKNAHNTGRKFHIDVNTSNGGDTSTPIGHEIHIKGLISQARNDTSDINGPTQVYVGSTATFQMLSSTSTQGYEQITHYLEYNPSIFQLNAANSTWSAPPPATVTDQNYYADACEWISDPTSTNYNECAGTGKAGGDIDTNTTYYVLSAGSFTMQPLIYDFSGNSYHYNADYGTGGKSVRAIAGDFGDLPDTYGTTLDANGSRHDISALQAVNNPTHINPYLGTAPDSDNNGSESADPDPTYAFWDNNNGIDDEDGVVFGPIMPGQDANITVTVSSECDSLTCNFSGWIDFNADGDFDDAGEQIFADQAVIAGEQNLTYSVPAGAVVDTSTYARFRLTTDTGITSKGLANDGEVEDYAITTNPVTLSYVYPQRNGDGLNIAFTTSSESRNVGFNIYAVKKGKWTKLNDELILGVLDSAEATDYEVQVSNPFGKKIKKIGIAGVDVDGREDRHGPYRIGKKNGIKAVTTAIDWKKIRKEEKTVRKAVKKAKKAERKAVKKVTRKLFKGEVVNLIVPESGVYRITHTDLLNAGIDLRGQKAKKIAISLKGKGIARHISGLNKRGKWTKNSVIEFKGETTKGSDALYLEANRYQLSLKKKLVVKSKGIDPDFTRELVFEKNNYYALSIPSDPFYDGYTYTRRIGEQRTLTRNFDMPILPKGTSTLKISLSALSEGRHHLLISLNGQQIADESAEGYMAWPITAEVDNALFVEGSNELTVTVLGEKNSMDIIVYDKLTVVYRESEANTPKTPAISLSDKVRKKELKISRGTNYLIISHPMFIGNVLDRYIKERRSEGWKVKVVNVEDIYDAYGYTMATPEAIKAYLKVAKKKGVTHVQLVGAASYDPHNYLGLGSMSFVPGCYVHTARTNHYTPTDMPYVIDESGLPAMAIGRWPVRTLAQLEAVVNKTLAWEESGQSHAHTALMIADRDSEFSKQMDQMIGLFSENANWTEFDKVYLSDLIKKHNGNEGVAVAEARSAITSSLNSGASVTMFSGHSSGSVWSFKGLLKYSDIPSLENTGSTTLALPLACYTTYADSPRTNTLAHQMLAAGENGAVAIYGSATLSRVAQNKIMATKVIESLLDGETLGEAVKSAKRSMGLVYWDIIYSSTILGDVTLKLK